jgi:hypothetical protein
MARTAVVVLKGFMWFVAAYHLFIGISLNLSPTFTQLIADAYGAKVDWTPQLVYSFKILGAFMVALGILAALTARDPLRHPIVPLGFVILFALRALQRLVFMREIESAFGQTPPRLVIQFVLMAGLAVALFLVQRRAHAGAVT